MGNPILTHLADRFRSGARATAAGQGDIEKAAGEVPLDEVAHDKQPTGSGSPTLNQHGRASPGSNGGSNGRSPKSPRRAKAAQPDVEKGRGFDGVASGDIQAASVESTTIDADAPPAKQLTPKGVVFKARIKRFGLHTKSALLHSKLNLLLVFVPVGIAAEFAKLSPGAVFGLNAVAIIPLAGLLTHATESVAVRLGDTLGALLNVSFGNAVELIIL
jgi:Ca2+:H+ antiporter